MVMIRLGREASWAEIHYVVGRVRSLGIQAHMWPRMVTNC